MIVWMMAAAAAPTMAGGMLAPTMAASAAGWNEGRLDAFMAAYADDAVYVTKQGVVRGKAAIAARYASSFVGGRNRRGRLGFAPLVERPLGPGRRLLIARWTLTGKAVESGLTTLVFERRAGAWKIVADHSS